MSKSFALISLRFAFLLLSTLPLVSNAARQKEAPLDTSILAHSDALRPYMTSQQRRAYISASELIEAGQSDIRSGKNLQQTRPSALDPNKDLKPIHARGERLEVEGAAKIREGQKQLVELLTSVQTTVAEKQAVAAKKYNFDLVEQNYQTALEEAATQTLEACRSAGYKNVFFDGMRIITAEQNIKAGPTLHNAAYDTWVKADGTQFSLKLPLDLKLTRDETTSEFSFQYENSSVFEGEKVALLAIELIAPGAGTDALLAVRALDLESQRLISSQLYYITDAGNVLNPPSEATEQPTTSEGTETAEVATEATVDVAPARVIPTGVIINEQNQIFEKLAGLATPYSFETVVTADNSAEVALIEGLLNDTLLKNSSLILVESNFILRSYLPADASTDDFASAGSAALALSSDAENYSIVAEAYGSGRTLEAGTLTLNRSE